MCVVCLQLSQGFWISVVSDVSLWPAEHIDSLLQHGLHKYILNNLIEQNGENRRKQKLNGNLILHVPTKLYL